MAVPLELPDLPPGERLEILRGRMRSGRVPLELRPYRPLDVRVRTSTAEFGSVHLLSTEGSGALVARTARLARDDSVPQLVVSVLAAGTTVLAQRGRVAHLRAGDIVTYSTTRPYENTFDPGTLKHSFMLPRDVLGLPDRLVDAQVARPLGPGHPLAPIVSSYLRNLAASAARLRPAHRDAAEQATIELVRALVTTAAGDEQWSRGPLAATLGVRITEYLGVHLADRDLTARRVAAAHGISERHLRAVLAGTGISMRSWVLERRLAAAAAALAAPANAQVTISALAHRWGFADHAHFSHAFRKAYGMTPTEWRRHQTPPGPR